jgi:hypothetical protein
MRWLLISLFVSVGALLLAAAGVARHIWLHHRKAAANKTGAEPGKHIGDEAAVDEIDVGPEL